MSKKIKSKTKTKKETAHIAVGIDRITESRQGVVLIRDIYEDHRAALLKMAKSDYVYGEENIRGMAQIAGEWLKEQGLPHDRIIYYAQPEKIDPIKINEIITKAEFEEKYENVDPATPGDGGRFGGMILPNFIEQLGYRRHDYQYLMAKIIILVHRALNPKNPKGAVFDAIFQLGRIFQQVDGFLRGDRRTDGSRESKGVKQEVRRAFDELDKLGDATKKRDIYEWLKDERVFTGRKGDWILVRNGKDIKITSFTSMVSKVRGERKGGKVRGEITVSY